MCRGYDNNIKKCIMKVTAVHAFPSLETRPYVGIVMSLCLLDEKKPVYLKLFNMYIHISISEIRYPLHKRLLECRTFS